MAELEQVTLGEVARRLEDVSGQIVRLADEIRQDRTLLAATYVPRETYTANTKTDDLRFKALELWITNQEAFRRQVVAGLVLLFFSTIAAIALAVSGLK